MKRRILHVWTADTDEGAVSFRAVLLEQDSPAEGWGRASPPAHAIHVNRWRAVAIEAKSVDAAGDSAWIPAAHVAGANALEVVLAGLVSADAYWSETVTNLRIPPALPDGGPYR